MAKRNTPKRVKLSHYPHDTAFLHRGTAASQDCCDICGSTIANASTYYYYDVGLHDKSPVIGMECYHKFHPMSYQRPYWMDPPTHFENIRTTDDAGWRELIDGLQDEWEEMFEGELERED